jgi:thiamine-monophosphate kinase
VGPGHDAAVVRLKDRRAVLHTDQCVEGVHFPKGTPWRAAAAKALLRCASDLAAMGARPVAALAAAALPARLSERNRRDLILGMERAAQGHGISIVGGDLSATSGPAVLGITVLGELEPGEKPILRRGARPGDLLAVTGRLGGSLLSPGRHLRPRPRIREALLLRKTLSLHAMIDLSDGLAADLGHLLDESRVGATLVGAWIPIHPDARGSLARALGDGEDYELLFAFPAAQAARLRRLPFGVTVVGQVTRKARRLLDPSGKVLPLPRAGWEHRWR